MSDNNSTTVYVGISFCGLLTIVFVVLKLIGVIEWSWLWVLAPLWISFIPLVLYLLLVLIAIVIIVLRR